MNSKDKKHSKYYCKNTNNKNDVDSLIKRYQTVLLYGKILEELTDTDEIKNVLNYLT